MCGQQKGQNRAKSHVRLTLKKKKKKFFFLEFSKFRFKSAIPRIPRLFRDRGKSLALAAQSSSKVCWSRYFSISSYLLLIVVIRGSFRDVLLSFKKHPMGLVSPSIFLLDIHRQVCTTDMFEGPLNVVAIFVSVSASLIRFSILCPASSRYFCPLSIVYPSICYFDALVCITRWTSYASLSFCLSDVDRDCSVVTMCALVLTSEYLFYVESGSGLEDVNILLWVKELMTRPVLWNRNVCCFIE